MGTDSCCPTLVRSRCKPSCRSLSSPATAVPGSSQLPTGPDQRLAPWPWSPGGASWPCTARPASLPSLRRVEAAGPPTARDPRGGRWTLQRADLPSLCKVSLRPSPASRPSAVPRVRCTRGSRQNPAHPAKPLTAVAPLRGLGLGWGRGSHPSPGAGVPLLGDEDGQHLGMPREARPAG